MRSFIDAATREKIAFLSSARAPELLESIPPEVRTLRPAGLRHSLCLDTAYALHGQTCLPGERRTGVA